MSIMESRRSISKLIRLALDLVNGTTKSVRDMVKSIQLVVAAVKSAASQTDGNAKPTDSMEKSVRFGMESSTSTMERIPCRRDRAHSIHPTSGYKAKFCHGRWPQPRCVTALIHPPPAFIAPSPPPERLRSLPSRGTKQRMDANGKDVVGIANIGMDSIHLPRS